MFAGAANRSAGSMSEPWRCQAKALRESSSGKALLCELETGEERWIPKSVIHDDSEVYDAADNAEGELVVQGWFADKEGLS